MKKLLLIYSINIFGFFQVYTLLASDYHLGDVLWGLDEVRLTSTPTSGGSVKVMYISSPPALVPTDEWLDATVNVLALPNTGFTFSHWTINGSAITHNSLSFTLSYRFWNGILIMIVPPISYTINAVFIATDPTIDSDGDSLSDIKERQFGSDPLVADTYDSLVDIINSIDFTNLGDTKFTLQEIKDLRAGSTMIAVENGQATLSMEVEQSDDLEIWTNESTTTLQIPIQAMEGEKFFRFKMNGSNSSNDSDSSSDDSSDDGGISLNDEEGQQTVEIGDGLTIRPRP